MRVLPVKEKKSMKVTTEEHSKWCQQSIASLDFEKLAKYLGVNICHDSGIILSRKEWEQNLDRLKKSHLTPLQKVQAIRETIVWQNLMPTKMVQSWIGSCPKTRQNDKKSSERDITSTSVGLN